MDKNGLIENVSRSINVYGPQGSGKTVNATKLAEYYNLKVILEVDNFPPNTLEVSLWNRLYLSQEPLKSLQVRKIPIEEALASIRASGIFSENPNELGRR